MFVIELDLFVACKKTTLQIPRPERGMMQDLVLYGVDNS